MYSHRSRDTDYGVVDLISDSDKSQQTMDFRIVTENDGAKLDHLYKTR